MVKDNDIYDFVIIGTSPIAITEAIFLQSQGHKILLLDSSSQIGGAWKTVSYDSIPEIEIGCHIWDIEKRVTNFLDQFYDLNLLELKPRPKIYYKGLSIPYDWKVNFSTTKIILRRTFGLKFKLLMKEMKSPQYRFSIFPAKYLYPKGGAKELVSKIAEKAKEQNLNFRLDTTLKSVEVMRDSITLNTTNQQITTKKLITTSLTHLSQIKVENKLLETPAAKQLNYIHIHLLVEGSSKKQFSYIRWINHPIIHRISDMTHQVRQEIETNQNVFAIGIHADYFEKNSLESVIIQVEGELRRKKIISKNQKIVSHETNTYPSHYSSTVFFRSLQKELQGRVSLLHSTNFTMSFYERIDQYEKLLE